jgi:hypothetical protein
MTNARLGHHGNSYRGLNTLNHFGVAHTSNATITTNVSGDSFKSHHRTCTRVFCDACLFRIDDIHNDPTLQHFSKTTLDALRAHR